MTEMKRIIGSVKVLGEDYNKESQLDEKYSKFGVPLIEENKSLKFKSKKGETAVVLYDSSKENNQLKINSNFVSYLATTQMLALSFQGTFTTSFIDSYITEKSDYKVKITFNDNQSFEYSTAKMVGNPFYQSNQTQIFYWSGINWSSLAAIKKIEFICGGFSQDSEKEDIQIDNLNFYTLMSSTPIKEGETYARILTPQGDHLNSSISRIVLQAQYINKGQQQIDGLSYLWFKENLTINKSSEYYNYLAGEGWEQLIGEEKDELYIDTITFNSGAKQYKVIIKNIETGDTQEVNRIVYQDQPTTYWVALKGKYQNEAQVSQLTEEILSIVDSQTLELEVWNIQTGKFSKENLLTAKIQWYKKNTLTTSVEEISKETKDVLELKADDIAQVNQYQVKIDNEVLSNVVTVKKELLDRDSLALTINNGKQVFLYDEKGKSPTYPTKYNKQTLYPLTFTLYDKNNKAEISHTIEGISWIWSINEKDSLILPVGNEYISTEDTLYFLLADSMIENTNNSQIHLSVSYRGALIDATTSFSFTQESTNEVVTVQDEALITKIERIETVGTPLIEMYGGLFPSEENSSKAKIEECYGKFVYDNCFKIKKGFILEGRKVKVQDQESEKLSSQGYLNIKADNGQSYSTIYCKPLDKMVIEDSGFEPSITVNFLINNSQYIIYDNNGTSPLFSEWLIDKDGSEIGKTVNGQPVLRKYKYQLLSKNRNNGEIAITEIGNSIKTILPTRYFDIIKQQADGEIFLRIHRFGVYAGVNEIQEKPLIDIPICIMMDNKYLRNVSGLLGDLIVSRRDNDFKAVTAINNVVGSVNLIKPEGTTATDYYEGNFTGLLNGKYGDKEKEHSGLYLFKDGIKQLELNADTGEFVLGSENEPTIKMTSSSFEINKEGKHCILADRDNIVLKSPEEDFKINLTAGETDSYVTSDDFVLDKKGKTEFKAGIISKDVKISGLNNEKVELSSTLFDSIKKIEYNNTTKTLIVTTNGGKQSTIKLE